MSSAAPLPAWISARHLQLMSHRGEAAGLPMPLLLEEAGITPALLADPDGLVPMALIEALLSAVLQRYPEALPGLRLAQDLQPASFGVLGYILQSAATLGEALEVLVRFNGLLSNVGRTSLRFGPGTVEVVWDCLAGSEALRRQATDYVLGLFVTMARLLLAENAELLRTVNFAHARPGAAAQIREYADFFRLPVYFTQEHSSVVLAVEALKQRLPHGDAAVHDLMQAHALTLLRRRSDEYSLVDAVRHLVQAMLREGVLSREVVAAQLGLSERSLHRHLQVLGSSYRGILDEVRMDVAQGRLQDAGASVSEISDLLGFSTHQAFLRWFRQQTGMTPAVYRRQKPGVFQEKSS
ncbi:MAG: AraC family transcriptional regulator [Pedobacter sp.]|nr:AraC family transcriptional regulator [Pedobacter sp.]